MTRSLTIFSLVTDAFGGRGGISQYNRDFLGALAECKIVDSILILPRRTFDVAEIPSAKIRQAPTPLGQFAYIITALWLTLFKRFDLVFCGHIYLAPLALIIARLGGAKLVVQTHGIEAWPQSSCLRRAALEAADLVLCVSRYTRQALLMWAAIAPERVLVLPNTVGAEFSSGDGATLRSKWGLTGKRIILTVSRLDAGERYKGHDRVFAAMVTLVPQMRDLVYVVVGEGDDRIRIEALAREVGVDDYVFFAGAVDRATLIESYRMADVFVMPSTGEGFGIAFLEAMASGTPAVGLNIGGTPDALGDGELGAVVSEAELSKTIAQALSATKPDPHVLSHRVQARFGRNIFAGQVGAILDRVVGNGPFRAC